MSLNIAAAIQSQMLQTLLQALQATDLPPKAGQTIEAKFIGWAEPVKPGTQPPTLAGSSAKSAGLSEANIEIAGKPTTLLIAATPERRAQLQPGATLTLQVETAASDGTPAQMRLLTIGAPREQALQGAQRSLATTVGTSHISPAKSALAATETVRAAAGPLVGAALGRQNGLAPLFADLAVLARSPQRVPTSVATAAAQALAMQTDARDAAEQPDILKAAVKSSGLFHEAMVAHGAPADAGKDLKTALLNLKHSLRDALAGAGSPEDLTLPAVPDEKSKKPEARLSGTLADMTASARPQAPARDGLPVPQGVALPSIDARADSAETMMTKVLERTEAALDRLTISQFASLPSSLDASQGTTLNRWFTELPLALDGRTAVLPLEIEEDHAAPNAQGAQAKLWRVRFALDVEPIGPVHAMVTMQGRSIGVTVWAERDTTSKLVRDHAPDLKAALLDSDFDNPQIEVLAGQPMKRPAHAGHYLDRRS